MVHICTDGSKSTEGVGFAAVFPNTTSGGKLAREASIFTAELYDAINAAVHEILKGTIDGNRFTIFSDSRSALLALRSDSSLSPILAETKELIRRAEEDNIIIDLGWVPGHVIVRGTEKADAAAKDAALRALTAPQSNPPHRYEETTQGGDHQRVASEVELLGSRGKKAERDQKGR